MLKAKIVFQTLLRTNVNVKMAMIIKHLAIVSMASLAFVNCRPHSKKTQSILLVVDGFKWDYVDRYCTLMPNLRRMIKYGVRAQSLTPEFPSLTCTCLSTIFTGRHAENHGIVGNVYLDPSIGKVVTLPCGSREAWLASIKSEHILVSLLKNNKRTAIIPESSFVANKMSTNDRLKVSVAKLIDENLDSVNTYIDEFDLLAHQFGPYSPQVVEAIRQFDIILGSVFRYLQCRRKLDSVNIVIVSDHGMVESSPRRVIDVKDCINVAEVLFMNPAVVSSIIPKNFLQISNLYSNLTNCNKNWTVYMKNMLPERFKLKGIDRVGPIVVIADEGWQIKTPITSQLFMGEHGYDNQLKSMGASFFAYGPEFKQGYTHKTFHQVHIYPILMKLVGIEIQHQIDGSLDNVTGMFR